MVVGVPVSRCRTCGRGAEAVLSPAELLRVATEVVEARARARASPPVLDVAAALLPSRLAARQLVECLVMLLDRRGLREELARAVETAELDDTGNDQTPGSAHIQHAGLRAFA
jgi:hypothetical protein